MKVQRSLLVGVVAAATLGLVPAGLAVASMDTASATTIKFVATRTGQNSSTKSTFEQTGTATRSGKLIGYYTLSCQLTSARCGGAGSFARGMIYFKFPLHLATKPFSGKVTGGTGAYTGATGTIKGKTISKKKEAVTITLT